MCQPPHLQKCTVDFGSITSRCSSNAPAALFFKTIVDQPSKRCNPALAYSTEDCINVAIDNKVKYGLLIKSIKHVRLLKDSWIRNSEKMYGWESYCHFSKNALFSSSPPALLRNTSMKKTSCEGPQNALRLGIRDFKENSGRDRDWNYAREVGYQK